MTVRETRRKTPQGAHFSTSVDVSDSQTKMVNKIKNNILTQLVRKVCKYSQAADYFTEKYSK